MKLELYLYDCWNKDDLFIRSAIQVWNMDNII